MQEETIKLASYAVRTHRPMLNTVVMSVVLSWTHCFAQVSQNTLASNPRIQELSTERRDRILDIAFSRDRGVARGEAPKIVIRFLPSFHPESQIEILSQSNSHASITYLRARSPLQKVARASFGTAHMTDSDLAKLLGVKTSATSLDSGAMDRLVVEFWKAVAESTDRMVRRAQKRELQLDGTEYSVSYTQGTNRFSLTVQDSEIDEESPQDLPLTHWMNALRRGVEGR